MQERIYINGVLMEQSDNKGISLVYQSQLFTDIDSIVSNRTNSVLLKRSMPILLRSKEFGNQS